MDNRGTRAFLSTCPTFDWVLQSILDFQLKRTQWRAIHAFRSEFSNSVI